EGGRVRVANSRGDRRSERDGGLEDRRNGDSRGSRRTPYPDGEWKRSAGCPAGRRADADREVPRRGLSEEQEAARADCRRDPNGSLRRQSYRHAPSFGCLDRDGMSFQESRASGREVRSSAPAPPLERSERPQAEFPNRATKSDRTEPWILRPAARSTRNRS